jgi:hypothetical protein
MEAECAALVVRTRASLVAFILQFETTRRSNISRQPCKHSTAVAFGTASAACHPESGALLLVQAANRHDAAELAAKQAELAALQAEAARLSSSNTAQAEHEARFRTAAERCAAPIGWSQKPGFAAACLTCCSDHVQQAWYHSDVVGCTCLQTELALRRGFVSMRYRAAEELAFMAHGISVQEVERTSMVVQIATHQGANHCCHSCPCTCTACLHSITAAGC